MSQNTANGATTIKLEDQEQPTLNQQLESIDWDSERQLISSLAKLQELESKIHELRTLLPDRLLSPLNPIVNPRLPISPSSSSTPIPRNPQALSAALRKSAIEGVTEINDFKSLWNSADMQAIWSKVDEKLAETKGAFPQEGAAGMWKVEYDEVLREMDLEEQKEDGRDRMQTEVEVDDGEAQFPSSIYGSKEETASPKSVIESFQARQIPGFRVASTRNESTIVVSLGLAGLAFEIQEALTTESTATTSTTTATTSNATNKTSLPEWRVSTRQHSKPGLSGSGTSRLESAIVAQLNSRPRKWDLRFLLVRLFPSIVEQRGEDAN
ncbi:hypothetical protein F66182_16291 [Fusarium sp. NRRL 66182]|nr:hypothetical protein F66182_16291 [Fusarium sp. NRRL 66182]